MHEQATPAAAPATQPATDPDQEDPEVTSKKFFYRVALGALGPIAMLMVILAAGLPKLGAPELAVPSRNAAIDAPRAVAAPPAPEPVVANPIPEETETRTTTISEHAGDANHAATSNITPAPAPEVVRASLCGDLDDWSCDPADRPVPTGPLFFLTQIKSPSATTIQHRWYQDEQLRQAVELRVQANRSAGYRTFSRNLMKTESAGRWRVEVRSQDGALLHQERFDVR